MLLCPHCGSQLHCLSCRRQPFTPTRECAFCNEQFLNGVEAQPIPPTFIQETGQKSGQPIWMSQGQPWDFIHVGCLKAYGDPEVNGGFDQLMEMARDQVRNEEFDSLKEAAYEEAREEVIEEEIEERIEQLFSLDNIKEMTRPELEEMYAKLYPAMMAMHELLSRPG